VYECVFLKLTFYINSLQVEIKAPNVQMPSTQAEDYIYIYIYILMAKHTEF